jgi:hypothetical protein
MLRPYGGGVPTAASRRRFGLLIPHSITYGQGIIWYY